MISFQENQEAINEKMEQERFEFTANQATIECAHKTIAKVQAILEATQAKQDEVQKRQDELVLHYG